MTFGNDNVEITHHNLWHASLAKKNWEMANHCLGRKLKLNNFDQMTFL